MAWPALAVIAIVSTARLASAEPQPPAPLALELVWEVPEGCPSAESVRHRIGQILRGPLTKPTSAAAKGRIESLPEGRFRLSMAVRTGDVEDVRTVDAASCGTLAEAFAVVVALAIDRSREVDGIEPPASLEHASPAAPAGEPSPEPGVAPAAQRELPAPRPVASRPQLRAEVGLGAFVVWGPLPDVSVGPNLSLGVRIDRFRFGALGAVSFQQRAAFERNAGATFDMIGGGAFGGYMIPVDAFAFGPCVSAELTHVRARGFGIRLPWEVSETWLTPALGGRVEARVARWFGFFASADLLLPIQAPIFSLATATGEAVRLHSPGRLSPRLSLGAEVFFP
jgi:hypothetical protein